jgi:hypothetical protein
MNLVDPVLRADGAVTVPGWKIAEVAERKHYVRTSFVDGRTIYHHHGRPRFDAWFLPSVVGLNVALERARAFARATRGTVIADRSGQLTGVRAELWL